MDKEQIFPLARQAMQMIHPQITPLFEKFADHLKIDQRLVGLLITAITFYPQPVSPTLLQKRSPYTNEHYFLLGMELARDSGLFDEIKPGEFVFTSTAREQTWELLAQIRQLIADEDPLPDVDSRRLGALLNTLVKAMVENPPSPEYISTKRSYAIMPAPEPPMPYIEQAISCLNAYRDDAHLAAWQPSGISATALETLTFLWRGEVDSLDALYKRLLFRNHSRETYAAALDELRKLGYIEGQDCSPVMTENGRQYRDRVELDTDEIYYKPWSVLTQAEIDELGELLTRLKDGLKTIQSQNEQ